ncbi:MAG TPA: OsmC family protein [Candidatus Binatia bacterium]|nr:OsmC family protein [Candidatus Binatia bacterium]
MQRKASAHWTGGLKDGRGNVSTQSGVLNKTQYSFSTRFENGAGTNPEELIAAAHAGCFSMALSAQLGNAGMTPESIDTNATLNLDKTDAGFTITAIHLEVKARIPGADPAKFDEAAQNAKKGCPVSRVLNANITMDAQLVS